MKRVIVLFLFFLGWIYSFCQDPKAHVLLVGLEHVNPKVFGIKYPSSATAGAQTDIDNISYMLSKSGFEENEITVIFNANATRQRIIDSLNSMAKKAKGTKDLIVFYFTGHGDSIKDLNGDEFDGKDEVLVCYDKLLVDDDLANIWRSISSDIRILMIVDACHSGTTYKMLDHKVNAIADAKSMKYKNEILFEKSLIKTEANTEFYSDAGEPFQMVYMSATKDSETANGGLSSEFTSGLLSVFNLYKNRRTEWLSLTYKKYWDEVANSVSGQNIVFAPVGRCKEILLDYPFKIK